MDLVDIITEKRFLGQEFLTWLWFKSEETGGVVSMDDSEAIVSFEKLMLLEAGEGETHEQVTCRGVRAELNEARTGLRMGKKLEQANIHLVVGDHEYRMTIKASRMEFRGVKFPKIIGNNDLDEVEGRLLDVFGMLHTAYSTVDSLFRHFVRIRVGDLWPIELSKMNAWVHA